MPTAWTEDGMIMGLRHRACRFIGVQFHPESIATSHGHEILREFPGICPGHKRAQAGGMNCRLKPVLARLAAARR